MSPKHSAFDQAAKARIMRAEVEKHGHVRPGRFASGIQRKVDRQEAKQKVTPVTTKAK